MLPLDTQLGIDHEMQQDSPTSFIGIYASPLVRDWYSIDIPDPVHQMNKGLDRITSLNASSQPSTINTHESNICHRNALVKRLFSKKRTSHSPKRKSLANHITCFLSMNNTTKSHVELIDSPRTSFGDSSQFTKSPSPILTPTTTSPHSSARSSINHTTADTSLKAFPLDLVTHRLSPTLRKWSHKLVVHLPTLSHHQEWNAALSDSRLTPQERYRIQKMVEFEALLNSNDTKYISLTSMILFNE